MKNILVALALLISFQVVSQTEKPETLAVIHTNYGDITIKLYIQFCQQKLHKHDSTKHIPKCL